MSKHLSSENPELYDQIEHDVKVALGFIKAEETVEEARKRKSQKKKK